MQPNKANLLLQSLNFYGDMEGSGNRTFKIDHPVFYKRQSKALVFFTYLLVILLLVCLKPSVSDSRENRTSQSMKEAESGYDLRKVRRLAIGIEGAGAFGLGGAILEINFNPDWSMLVGFGGAEGLQALNFVGKYILAGDSFLPYVSMGYSRWSSTDRASPISKTTPSFLGDKLLTEDQKNQGEFQENLFVPSIGLQYLQSSGDWAGFSIFTEFNLLVDVAHFVAAPTAGVGCLYYF